MSAGYAVAAVTGAGPGRTNARYAASRSVALLALATAAAAARSRAAVIGAAATMTVVQSLDAVIGASNGEVAKSVGPAVLATVTLAAAAALLRSTAVAPTSFGAPAC